MKMTDTVENVGPGVDIIYDAESNDWYFNAFPGGAWMYSQGFTSRVDAMTAYTNNLLIWE